MITEKIVRRLGLNRYFHVKTQDQFIVHLCPYIATENIGDEIIFNAVQNETRALFPEKYIALYPTHTPLNTVVLNRYNTALFRFVGGTNILNDPRVRKQWAVNLRDAWRYRPAILMGVGWGQYQKNPGRIARWYYHALLEHGFLHSVRDSYTEEKLRRLGFTNVLNTACPTTWKLTPAFCKNIPTEKKNSVVITLTDYAKNPERDRLLLQICTDSYSDIYFFPQSTEDTPYFHSIYNNSRCKIKILPPNLESYNHLLDEIQPDFVGTRLHGGIRAMQRNCRAMIIAIDNRAQEMGRDINLPIIQADAIAEKLPQTLKNGWKVDLKIPLKNIENWKAQFATIRSDNFCSDKAVKK